MKKILEISLGIVTSIGGFLEIGALTTAAQAGASFGFQLIWAMVLGTLCVIFMVEMCGRFSAVSQQTIPDALRKRFGLGFFLIPLIATLLIDVLVLAAEIGGMALALQFVTGIGFQWWALPVAFLVWLLLWKGTFGFIENGISILGLVTLCFVVGAVLLHPPWMDVLKGAVPSLPTDDKAHYWFIAVSILGAAISPYLFFFYSSGAIEDGWDKSYIGVNRVIAVMGMGFGGFVAIAVIIVAAQVFGSMGIARIDSFDQIALIMTPLFGYWGFILLAASLAICCLGAALELALEQAYMTAQGFGWNWGENVRPGDDPGFSLVYTLSILVSALPIAFGVDPLQLTVFSMAITAATLPLAIVPFLFLMNDETYVGEHRNGWISNTVVLAVIALGFGLAIVTIPLEILGG